MAKVVVGLSGGVDSAVAAALLLEEGHEVIGAFIKIWQPEFIECTWKEDRLSAKRVAAHLGIPFMEFDFSEIYKEQVITDMLRSYQDGETPNPDVLCNRHIKFGALWEAAQALGATHVATGHYAQVKETPYGFRLLRGRDSKKDQSYFLWRLQQEDLSHILFPLGMRTKSEVRELAKGFKLPNAQRPDSQGLCFVGDITLHDFLARYITLAPGLVLNTSNEIIGEHYGVALYTIGQRAGFSIKNPQLAKQAHFIVDVNVQKNSITVSSTPQDAKRDFVELGNSSWVSEEPLADSAIQFEVRYHQGAQEGTYASKKGVRGVYPEIPQVVARGQSVVIFQGEMCLGGGVAL